MCASESDGVLPPHCEAPSTELRAGLLFRQKDPKPCSLWRGLSDSLRGSPTPSALLRTGPAASKLAEPALCPEPVEGSKDRRAQTVLAESPKLAALPGHAKGGLISKSWCGDWRKPKRKIRSQSHTMAGNRCCQRRKSSPAFRAERYFQKRPQTNFAYVT